MNPFLLRTETAPLISRGMVTVRRFLSLYYPAPASNTQASILPPPNGSMGATYVFPALQQVS